MYMNKQKKKSIFRFSFVSHKFADGKELKFLGKKIKFKHKIYH